MYVNVYCTCFCVCAVAFETMAQRVSNIPSQYQVIVTKIIKFMTVGAKLLLFFVVLDIHC